MTEVVISSAARTAVGRYGGSLKDQPPTDLGALTARTALERSGLEPDQVDQVVFGNVIHSAPEDMYMARVVAIKAGIPQEVPALTVNRLCGTGVQAIVSAAQSIETGDADVVIAGGAESMSRVPYWMPHVRWGARMGETKMVGPVVGGLTDPFNHIHMGVTAENLAESHSISREEQDEFSVESHQRAARAQQEGLFDEEIVPVRIPQRKGDPIEFRDDEGIRADTTVESLARLRPAFAKDGTITAGSSSQISDGACAVVVMSRAKAAELGAPVLAEIGAHGVVAGPDNSLQSQPSNAINDALRKEGLAIGDLDLIEINEAFAAVGIQSMKDLGVDAEKVNVNGGAIALGHPIGMSGARLALTLALELRRRGGGTGAAALCGGGGQGDALILHVPA